MVISWKSVDWYVTFLFTMEIQRKFLICLQFAIKWKFKEKNYSWESIPGYVVWESGIPTARAAHSFKTTVWTATMLFMPSLWKSAKMVFFFYYFRDCFFLPNPVKSNISAIPRSNFSFSSSFTTISCFSKSAKFIFKCITINPVYLRLQVLLKTAPSNGTNWN